MTGAPRGTTVVVHCDGTWDSRRAVRAAALQADRLGVGLTALVLTSPLTPVGSRPHDDHQEHRQPDGDDTAERATQDARRMVPGLPVEAMVARSDSAQVDRLGARARLLVLGRYGRSGRPALAPGSVTADLAARTTAPVLVVGRDPTSHDHLHAHPKVVVGLAGRRDDRLVADEAVDEARRRGWPVLAVCAVDDLTGTEQREAQLLAARQAAYRSCAGTPGATPVDVSVETVGHDPLGALRWHCGPRDLAVVGHHTADSAHPRALGPLSPASLAERLLHTGICDVLVVPLAPLTRTTDATRTDADVPQR